MRYALAAALLGLTLASPAGMPQADPVRLAQRTVPVDPVPGGLPGRVPEGPPAPQNAPPLPAPRPLAPPAAPLPDAAGPGSCDCYAEVDVPVYQDGRIVAWRKQQRPAGRSPQCCRR